MAWSFQKICRAQPQNHEWEYKIDEEVGAWKVGILPSLLSEYCPKDIFNANQCGLFSSVLPDKTCASKDGSCHGGKRSKSRITVLLCANMD
jgi:hypothetical protein